MARPLGVLRRLRSSDSVELWEQQRDTQFLQLQLSRQQRRRRDLETGLSLGELRQRRCTAIAQTVGQRGRGRSSVVLQPPWQQRQQRRRWAAEMVEPMEPRRRLQHH